MRDVLVMALALIPTLALAQGKSGDAPGKKQAPGQEKKAEKAADHGKQKWTDRVSKGDDLYATIETSMGRIEAKLFAKDAPKTVENFVGLAMGEKEWTDPKTGTKQTKPLYDGTIFHRVIPNFMIQGGDPLGQGTGGPGYQFQDEFGGGKVFDKPCLLAMANSGPNTNGSQFFITEKPTPWLNGKHTIFGEVTQGCDLVEKMARVEAAQDRPKTDLVIKHIAISDKAPKGSDKASEGDKKGKK